MKMSEHHKVHGLPVVIRSVQSGTELHLNFAPVERRQTVLFDVGGHAVEGYVELLRRHTSSDEEHDLDIVLRMGPRPETDYAPAPAAVLGNTSPVSTPKSERFAPGPGPRTVPLPESNAVPVPEVEVEDRFKPGPGPNLSDTPPAKVLVPDTAPEEDPDEDEPGEVEQEMVMEFAKKEAKPVRPSRRQGR